MYRLGCKGGTIYRDGSRDEQVLNLKKEEPAAPAVPARPLTQMEKVRPRPDVCRGVTVKKATPVGTAFVTMNDDEAGQPFEVFVETGKTGSDIKAMAEAMGRLMSLVLRLASPLTPREKVQQIVNQVRGIGGARSLGFGKERIRSLPDAVAQALEEQYAVHANGNGYHPAPEDASGNGKPEAHRLPTDLCPSCGVAAFVHEEGCMTCHSCGYSEC
jgi:ribonucleoside-diphosphate reductase alpha chain